MKKFVLFILVSISSLTLVACRDQAEPIDVTVDSQVEAFINANFDTSVDVIEVTQNIQFPTTFNDTTIIWFSYNQDVIENNGTIHRPGVGEDPITVQVTFTMYSGNTSETGSITFSVLPLEEAIEDWGYYEGAQSLTNEDLKTFLHELIDDHTMLSYSQLWTALADTDEDPNNPDNVILIYSQISMDKDSMCGASCPSTTTWNREHVWPKSHGGFDTGDIEGTDLHHIRPSLVIVNGDRGNLDFDLGGSLQDYTTDSFIDSDSFEPDDDIKGDVARMIFYMAVRYEGDAGELDLELNDLVNNSGPYMGKLSILIQWHLNDLPDAFEMERNNRIYEWQGNRNPFIDHPEFVELIWNS